MVNQESYHHDGRQNKEAQINPQDLEQQALLQTRAQEWLSQVDEDSVTSVEFMSDEDGQVNKWQVYDAVNKRVADEAGNLVLVPTAILRKDEEQIEVPVTELLSWQDAQDVAEQSTEKAIPNTRSDLLFAPVVMEDKAEPDMDFSYLLNPNAPAQPVEAAAVRSKIGRHHVSTESVEQAKQWLDLIEPGLREIITSHDALQGRHLNQDDIVKLIRTNLELRKGIGEYLLQKLEDPNVLMDMPRRVAANDRKNAGTTGYKHIPGLRSREYVSLLALSYLDGTFNESNADMESYDPRIYEGSGQHRYAARQLMTLRTN